MTISTQEYLQSMRLFPAAVSIIATGFAPERAGLTATAVMSLSADPARIVCAVNQCTYTYSRIAAQRFFSVNTLAEHQVQQAQFFSGKAALSGDARFREGDWTTLVSGAPVLQEAMLNLDCALVECIDAGSHALLIGNVLAARRCADRAPLLYMDGAWGRLAPQAELV
jgi:flavin reductase (DIM6/NTAB) family NADH-FMN oxidoreductase RutF